jgi:5'-nucleotidase
MNILITNDDGFSAPGILALVGAAMQWGEVVVVAPDTQKSACGHGMTMRNPLRVQEISDYPCKAFSVDGLPTDCINVGRALAFENGIDFVLSGINAGPNLGIDTTYSGTVAGAMEACLNGIPAFSISMATTTVESPQHFDTGASWLLSNWEWLSKLPFPGQVFYNLNIPAVQEIELRGHQFCALGQRVYEDRIERRSDPWGREYWWQGGVAMLFDREPNTDIECVSQGFVSITPVTTNWTEKDVLLELQKEKRQTPPL